MELKLYQCQHCKNIIYKAYDSGAAVSCCGEEAPLMEASVTGTGAEKHIPIISKNGSEITVSVSEITHPMEEKHYIPLIAAHNEDTVVFKCQKPGQESSLLKTTLDGSVTAYEWCNLHGLWKGE